MALRPFLLGFFAVLLSCSAAAQTLHAGDSSNFGEPVSSAGRIILTSSESRLESVVVLESGSPGTSTYEQKVFVLQHATKASLVSPWLGEGHLLVSKGFLGIVGADGKKVAFKFNAAELPASAAQLSSAVYEMYGVALYTGSPRLTDAQIQSLRDHGKLP